ncbi:hypothetical protein CEXT_705681 [Caerostris extrusa]|uniref:Uncharacterized protein n=1 Tax=Caerostris extrusa TaxID=172846 RepID=A0AAV4YB57_CAEEX|nr:hypothetical protein CEXT_705681 [Caerostris extrusa]
MNTRGKGSKRFDKNDEILPKTSVKSTGEKIIKRNSTSSPPLLQSSTILNGGERGNNRQQKKKEKKKKKKECYPEVSKTIFDKNKIAKIFCWSDKYERIRIMSRKRFTFF